jgi:NTE family protein
MRDDGLEGTVIARSDLRVVISALPLFAGLEDETLFSIAAEVEWLSLPGGATLFEAGEPADAMYIVLSGCLAAFVARREADRRRTVSRVLAGDTVGEMGLISGRPRSASVVALRDTELARLSREAFDRVFRQRPEAMLRIAQLTVDRLESSESRPRGSAPGVRTFALLPQSSDVDIATFAKQLVSALRTLGRTEVVWSVRGTEHTSHWFHRLETVNDYVVYVADAAASSWSKRCVRQADALLLLARAAAEPASWQVLSGGREASMAPQRSELVLLHADRIQRGAAARWLASMPAPVPHHHIVTAADVPRVARLLTGTGVGIVLSGGGARGFAHIGVVRALRESGIPVDVVGGTSMGGILGAGVASGWTVDELIDRFRRTFVDVNPLRDYTLPVVSLVSGRRVSALLRQEFGDLTIEDLPLPFFCVSSNLTTGQLAIHRRGELWRWLRASVAIPGVLPPVMHGGEVLVDGGAMNNLPVDVMRELGRGPVIGVDVGGDRAFAADSDDIDVPPLWKVLAWLRGRRRRPNIFQILWRAGMVNSAATTVAHREKTDLLLQPPLESIDMLNWKAFERAIAIGYEYAARRLEALPSGSPLYAGRTDGEPRQLPSGR